MVVFLGLGVVGLGFPRGAVAPAAEEDGGGGAPAADWRQQVGKKPHGSKVKLLGWLGGAEQYWNDGSTASRAAAELGYGDEGAPVEV